MMNFRWSCLWSDFRWSCQWSVTSWSSRRLDSNRVLIRLSRLIRISGLGQFSKLNRLPGIDLTLRIDSTDPLIQSSQLNVFLHSFKSGFLIHLWLISSDLRRSCTVCQLIPLEQISLADASEWFPFCSDLDLRRNSTVHKKFLQALMNLFPFGAHSDRT